jgi:uncharacterized protein
VRRGIILDTGPLVASIDRNDSEWAWTTSQLKQIAAPILTCESVLSEACFLLSRVDGGPARVLELVCWNVLSLPFRASEHVTVLAALMRKFADIPMSFADACLVRMSELYPDAAVLTFDSGFRVYRRNGRQSIPLRMPPGR